MLFKPHFFDRFQAHFFHRANWWVLAMLFWLALHWRFGSGEGIYAASSNLFPCLALVLSYFAFSPALFFTLADVDPERPSRAWGYLVGATWPVYVLDHIVNLTTLAVLYILMDTPWGWGLFFPITQFFYTTFYAARAYLRRIGYYDEFDQK